MRLTANLGVVGVVLCCLTATQAATTLQLIGQTAFNTGPGTEQVAYDDKSKVAYLIGNKQLYVIDMSPAALLDNGQPAATPKPLSVLQTKNLTTTVNDVSFCGDYLAISANGNKKTDPGTVTILNRYLRGVSLQGSSDAKDAASTTKDSAAAAATIAADSDATIVRGSLTYRRVSPNRRPGSLEQLAQFTVGALPDQLTFSKDCKTILVSNEGEPENYLAPAGGLDKDPEGSVSVINLFFCDDHEYGNQGYSPRHEHDYGRDHGYDKQGYAMKDKEAGFKQVAADKEGAAATDKTEDSKKAAAAGAKKGGHKRLDSRRSKTGKSDPEKTENKDDKKDDKYGSQDDNPNKPNDNYPREDAPYSPKGEYPREHNSLYKHDDPSRDYYPEPRPHYEEPRYEPRGQIPGCKGNEIYGIVRTATFTAWNDKKAALVADNIKFTGVNATVAQDLEPEYTTFTEDEKYAFVSLQENNAVAVVDVEKAEIRSIHGLGFKNHNLDANKLDPSDQDNSTVAPQGPAAKINAWPVFGMYQPDEIASYSYKGDYYLVTANEGDARTYDGLNEERRGNQITSKIDPTFPFPSAFPNAAALMNNAALGRLTMLALSTPGRTGDPYGPYSDPAGTGKFSKLFSFGARSFSIWRLNDPSYSNPSTATLEQVFDSGSQLEDISKAQLIEIYNSELGLPANFDLRSDNKGPEPEGLSIGPCNEHYYSARPYYGDYRRPNHEYPRYDREYPEEQEHRGRTCLYLGTERLGVMFVYDITNPYKPVFQSFAKPPTSGGASFGAPEGVQYTRYNLGPRSFGMVLVAYEADPDKPAIPAGLGVYKVTDA